jgi:DNA-binding MarR family transcriptional regulator
MSTALLTLVRLLRQQEPDVTLRDVEVLCELPYRGRQALTINQDSLRDILDMERTLISKSVSRLVKNGFARRNISNDDGRMRVLARTPKGHALIQKLASYMENSDI